jgi:hypothetical protein
MENKEEIDIGEAIKQKVKERGMSVVDFAAAINCERTNVYSLFKRTTMNMEQLQVISGVLEHDFVSEVYLNRPPHPKKYLIVCEVDEQKFQEMSADNSIKYFKELTASPPAPSPQERGSRSES